MKSHIFSYFPFFLLLLSSIVQAQNSTCYTCFSPKSKTCEEVKETCPGKSDCMTISQEFTARGVKFESIEKRCAMNMPCNISVSGQASSDLYLKSYLKCCTGDQCNSDGFYVPKKDPQEKGILCPFCHEYDTLDGCNATKSTVCSNKDDLCAKFRGTIEGPDGVQINISAQGCISPSACKYDFTEVPYMKLISAKENECYTPQPEKKPNQ